VYQECWWEDNINNHNNHYSYRYQKVHFRDKKKQYLQAKIDELETNSKIKIIRDLYEGINGFKKGYQPRTNIVKNEKDDLVRDCHSILARWRKYFFFSYSM